MARRFSIARAIFGRSGAYFASRSIREALFRTVSRSSGATPSSSSFITVCETICWITDCGLTSPGSRTYVVG
ncbi:Uncharacterised protein [Mycobacteroides abscessus]|nr:Uncharacterised protein [Mycobacteroides abscessus]